ncbi:MAG TPA: hypothetical protein VFK28_01855 [Sphingomicrobium sp.]|nr:hypothetical protein [Sphingomicrobium sp.]
MDTYREHPGDFDLPASTETAASHDVAAAIGTDERRMHVRAYNYWVSLLDGRDFPSIEDLEPADVTDFAANSVLLDFTCGGDNPAIPYIGAAIREECGLSDDTRTIGDVPSRSLLSRLTDHYLQIIANRAPIGFEAEFANQRSETICYRGILMPFSSDGDAIDFIYGVINWKTVGAGSVDSGTIDMPRVEFASADDADEVKADAGQPLELTEVAAEDALELTEIAPEEPLELSEFAADETILEPVAAPLSAAEQTVEIGGIADAPEAPPVHFSWEDGPLADVDSGELPQVDIDENAGLADRLWAARETADAVKAGEGRTRTALYRALSLAYDFALAAHDTPQEYAELLEESGVKAQARAPMTPIVKLVFGIDYDKARLTEFAAALSYARRQELESGAFQGFIEKQPGGLKALVAAERQARRPGAKPDSKGEIARARLRTAAPISLADVPSDEEFAVVVTRRGPDGRHEAVAILDDEALVERAIRGAA